MFDYYNYYYPDFDDPSPMWIPAPGPIPPDYADESNDGEPERGSSLFPFPCGPGTALTGDGKCRKIVHFGQEDPYAAPTPLPTPQMP